MDEEIELPSEGDSPERIDNPPVPPVTLPAPRPGRPRRRPSVEGLPDSDSLRGQVYALTGAQQVMFERLDQSLKLQDQSYTQLQGLMTQMNETLRLWQQSFTAVQEMTDKLARIAAATVVMYQLQAEANDQGLF